MKDNLSIVITVILLVVLIVIFPLYNYFERQDDMSYNLALKATTNFVDEVLNSGYITDQMYADYISELANTGIVYDVSLEAHRKKLGQDPEMQDTYDEIYIIEYNNEILDIDSENISNVTLESSSIKNGIYSLNRDDKFYVKLKNSSMTMAGAIFNAIIPTSKKERIVVNYGGIVKNNAWEKVDSTFSAHMRDPEAPVISTTRNPSLNTTIEGEEYIENIVSIGNVPSLQAISAVYSVTGMEDNRVEKYIWQDVTNDREYSVDPNNNEKISEKVQFKIGDTYVFRVWAEDSYRNKSDKVIVKIKIVENPRPSTPVVGIILDGEEEVLSTTKTNELEIDDTNTLWAKSTSELDISHYEWEIRYENGDYITKTNDISKYNFAIDTTYKLVVYAVDIEGNKCETPCTVTIKVLEYLAISTPKIAFSNSSLEETQVFKGNTINVYVENKEEGVTYRWYLNDEPVMTGTNVAIRIDKLADNEIYCIASRGDVKSENTLKVWGYNFVVKSEQLKVRKEYKAAFITHIFYIAKIDSIDGDKNVRYNYIADFSYYTNDLTGYSENNDVYDDNKVKLFEKNMLYLTGKAKITVWLSNKRNTIVTNKVRQEIVF